MIPTSKEEDGCSKFASLSPEIKEILHQSILYYLHRNGFSKTLKRFQYEAQIQNDTWKASSLYLEDIYYKYMGIHEKTTTSKKKKKSGLESENGDTEDQLKSTKSDGEIPEYNLVVESETKAKKKKKSKHDLASSGKTEEAKLDVAKKPVDDTKNGLEADESIKPKEKKRKSAQNDQQVLDTENGGFNPDVTKKEKTSSKKRKRLSSDENEHQSAEMESIEESKHQKNESDAQETCDKQLDGHGNGKPEINGGGNPGSQKSNKKQRYGSAEPKTVNVFQRVKIDEVEFAHEKLQDNSYWAKDGADIGYGAKAEEVLGQVRGRGFRHEKTKKKRGSYRGGQIDLQSHSIKFNYSDEE